MNSSRFIIHETINGNVYVWDTFAGRWSGGDFVKEVESEEPTFGWVRGQAKVFGITFNNARVMGKTGLTVRERKRDFGSVEAAKSWIDEKIRESNPTVRSTPYPGESKRSKGKP